MLSLCYFNVYCCFLIALLVYLFNQLPYFETLLKFRPPLRRLVYNKAILITALEYYVNSFVFNYKNSNLKLSLETLFYNTSTRYSLFFFTKFIGINQALFSSDCWISINELNMGYAEDIRLLNLLK